MSTRSTTLQLGQVCTHMRQGPRGSIAAPGQQGHGLHFSFSPDALCQHHDSTSLGGSLAADTRNSGLAPPGLVFYEKGISIAENISDSAFFFSRLCQGCKFRISRPARRGRRQHCRSWHAHAQLKRKVCPNSIVLQIFRGLAFAAIFDSVNIAAFFCSSLSLFRALVHHRLLPRLRY